MRYDHELTFDGVFARRVEDGSTILALVPPTRSRPPAVGQPVALFNAGWVKAIAVANVVTRARLILTPTGVARVLFPVGQTSTPNGALIWRLLEGLEQHGVQSASIVHAFAQLAGFPRMAAVGEPDVETRYACLYAFHLKTEQDAGRRTPRGRIVREMIGWGAVR